MQRVSLMAVLPAVLREFGVDSGLVLRDAGLPPDAIDRPDSWIPVLSALNMLQAAAERAQCLHIGLLVGQRFQFSHIALLGELMLNSGSVGDALRSYVVHQRLYSQAFTPFLQDYGRIAEYGFAFYQSVPSGLPVAYDMLLAALATSVRTLCGEEWNPSEVRFARSAPADLAPYRTHFRCNLRFDSDHASVVLRAEDLDRPIAGADPLRFRALEQEAIEKFDSSLLPLLYRSLRAMLVTGDPKASRLAEEFAMHERTLARRLRAQGTSFRAVLDEVRYETARALLADTTLTSTDIAASLGYAEAAPFIRAFNRWAGMSPGDWRAANRRQPSLRRARGSG